MFALISGDESSGTIVQGDAALEIIDLTIDDDLFEASCVDIAVKTEPTCQGLSVILIIFS